MIRDGTRLYVAIAAAILLGGCCKNAAGGEADRAQFKAIADKAEAAQARMTFCLETPPKADACDAVKTALGEIQASAKQGGGQ
jgi:hypothetical protein